MENARPRQVPGTIEHILIHRAALAAHSDRIADIVGRLPGVEPVITDELNSDTIEAFMRKKFPRAEILHEKKTASAVTVGKRVLVIGLVDREKGVEEFNDSKGMVCHGFHHIMVMTNGCVYNCQYCFLQQHIWDKDVSSHMRLNVNYEDIVERMRQVAADRLAQGQRTRFHTGIMLDYLGFEAITGFLEFMIPKLADEAFAMTCIEMWSKGNDIRVLLDAAARYPWATKRLHPGWSINSSHAADRYEPGTARTVQRLQAARELQDAGYSVTIRIDPIVPYATWKEDYRRLVDMIFQDFGLRPHVMLLGSLRFDEPDLIHTGRQRFPNSDLFSMDFPLEDRAKYRVPFARRMEVFQTLIDQIRRNRDEQIVGTCKENMKTWKHLGLDPTKTCLAEPRLKNSMHSFILD